MKIVLFGIEFAFLRHQDAIGCSVAILDGRSPNPNAIHLNICANLGRRWLRFRLIWYFYLFPEISAPPATRTDGDRSAQSMRHYQAALRLFTKPVTLLPSASDWAFRPSYKVMSCVAAELLISAGVSTPELFRVTFPDLTVLH